MMTTASLSWWWVITSCKNENIGWIIIIITIIIYNIMICVLWWCWAQIGNCFIFFASWYGACHCNMMHVVLRKVGVKVGAMSEMPHVPCADINSTFEGEKKGGGKCDLKLCVPSLVWWKRPRVGLVLAFLITSADQQIGRRMGIVSNAQPGTHEYHLHLMRRGSKCVVQVDTARIN